MTKDQSRRAAEAVRWLEERAGRKMELREARIVVREGDDGPVEVLSIVAHTRDERGEPCRFPMDVYPPEQSRAGSAFPWVTRVHHIQEAEGMQHAMYLHPDHVAGRRPLVLDRNGFIVNMSGGEQAGGGRHEVDAPASGEEGEGVKRE